MTEATNDIVGTEMIATASETVKYYGGDSRPACCPEGDHHPCDGEHSTVGTCDAEGTALEPQHEEMDAIEVNVMGDYIDYSSSSSSPVEDPFDQYDSASQDSDSKPRRKKFTLASHITIIDDTSPACYYCTACKSYFSHKHTARNHEFCGTGKKPFKCKLCEKRFVKRSDRDNHHKIHTGERSFECSICDRSFYLKHKLNRHMRSHTGLRGDFICSTCSRSFICREALKKHQVNKHNPNKSIQCENCGKTFTRTEEKKKHKCAHPSKKKKLVCEVCGKTFSKNWNLTVHLRIHVGQRPFKCSTCNKSFRLRQHLERHSTKHQADADFECMLCQQTFGRKDNMIRHLKLNHPDRHLGIDIKDMVQRSQKAKLAKSKIVSDEQAVDEPEAQAEKTLTVLPVSNMPNIRFAQVPSSSSNNVSVVQLPKNQVETPSVVKKPCLAGPSAKSIEARIEKSVILQTVIRSEGNSVVRETRKFVQSTIIERVDPFKSVKLRSSTTEDVKSQPSVLVFNKSRATPPCNEPSEECARSSALSGLLDRPNDFKNHIELKTSASTQQQISVLRFGSKDPNTQTQR